MFLPVALSVQESEQESSSGTTIVGEDEGEGEDDEDLKHVLALRTGRSSWLMLRVTRPIRPQKRQCQKRRTSSMTRRPAVGVQL